MPFIDPISPAVSKLNWLGIATAGVSILTALLNSEWVAANPKLTMILTAAVGILTVLIRTLWTIAPTTMAKLAVIFVLTFPLLAADIAFAAPTACVRGPDGVVRCGGQQQRPARGGIIRRILGR